MKCPADVRPDHFDAMLESVPAGFVYKRSFVPDDFPPLWREFVFVATRQVADFKKGEELVLSCVRNVEVTL